MPFPIDFMNNYKISFCTVCRNRLQHLKKTLLKNIEDNIEYPGIEFILLDYNSSDGLEEFAQKELKEYIDSGKLIYYRNDTAPYFHRSHSRNMAFRLATGDILCNIDADNFTGKDFAFYVNAVFNEKENIFLATTGFYKDVLGRIGIRKNDFFKVGGLDEHMSNYGFEDLDIINRLELAGLDKVNISDPRFLHAIEHSDKERISEENPRHTLMGTLLNYINYSSSNIIFLFTERCFEMATIVDNYVEQAHDYHAALRPAVKPEYEFSILQKNWIKGSWQQDDHQLRLQPSGSSPEILLVTQDDYGSFIHADDYGTIYYPVEDDDMIEEALFFHSQISNRIIMKENLAQKKIRVNENEFGSGEVYKNFDRLHPINI